MWGSGMVVTCFAEASIELARCLMVVGALSEADLWFSSHLCNSKRPRKLLREKVTTKLSLSKTYTTLDFHLGCCCWR
ncbi:hypothetical protein P8452_65663 [Trifolium repens]|nr:hypothetical protein P8452_65663 [Trifolium repens]